MKVGDVFYDYEAELSLVITFEKYDMFWIEYTPILS